LTASNAVASLALARDLSDQPYGTGAIARTDVLDADRPLLAAQDDLARNRADAAREAARSYCALGGGWPVTKARLAES